MSSVQHIPLADLELRVLNKVVGTRTFGDFYEMKAAFQKNVDEQKATLLEEGATDEVNFPLFKTQAVNNIIQFLLRNEFYSIREGGVYFLTEKGKYLQKQKSVENYVEWEMAREDKLIQEMHTIENQGYLEKDQTFKKEHKAEIPVAPDEETKKNFGWYILILIVLIVLAAIGKSHKWW